MKRALPRRAGRVAVATAIALAVAAIGCGDDDGNAAPESAARPATETTGKPADAGEAAARPAATPVADTRSREELVADGRSVYNANCIACHAMDPTIDGALGPAVAGASLELLEARIVRGEYPPGYEPKRPSRVMVPLPHLEPKLPELAAYLQSFD